MPQEFNCPSCGAPLDPPGGGQASLHCPFCGSSVIVPEELRGPPAVTPPPVQYIPLKIETTSTWEELPSHPVAKPARRGCGTWLALALLLLVGGIVLVSNGFTRLNKLASPVLLRASATFPAGLVKTRQAQAVIQAQSQMEQARSLAEQADADLRATQSALERSATGQAEDKSGTATAASATAVVAASATQDAATLQAQVAELQASIGTPQAWRKSLSDTFDSSGHGWPTGSVRNAYYTGSRTISQGRYRWNVQTRTGMITQAFPTESIFQDCYASLTASGTLPPDASWGLVLRESQDQQSWYFFALRGDGSYAFTFRQSSDIWNTPIDWKTSRAIRPDQNTLAVAARGDEFTLLINGRVVDYIQDSSLHEGYVGLGLDVPSANQSLQLDFDNFMVQTPR